MPFGYILDRIKPVRDNVRRDNHRKYWWQYGEARPGMRKALKDISRYIITPLVAKTSYFYICTSQRFTLQRNSSNYPF
ncbi:hypothetical protein [Chromatium okenii]|uniref:hypothetical protein n=1 Tax=Chromatium okenii TaxID=61644 RepID=UPI0018D4FC46|nr:hypothetical protein [Chromatium okenii]